MKLYDVRIWRRVLSTGEIYDLYREGQFRFMSPYQRLKHALVLTALLLIGRRRFGLVSGWRRDFLGLNVPLRR